MLALRRSWWLSLSVAALIACSKPEPPTVTPQSARVTRVDPLGLTLAVTVEVHNPNSFPLVVQSVDGTMALATGTPLGSGRAALQSSIPANGSSSVAGELAIPWANLAALAPYALSPADVPYSFRGTAQLGSERLNVGVPFEVPGVLSRAQVLELGLRGLKDAQ